MCSSLRTALPISFLWMLTGCPGSPSLFQLPLPSPTPRGRLRAAWKHCFGAVKARALQPGRMQPLPTLTLDSPVPDNVRLDSVIDAIAITLLKPTAQSKFLTRVLQQMFCSWPRLVFCCPSTQCLPFF